MLHRNPARVAAPRAKRPCLVLMLRVMAGSGAPIDGTFGPSAGHPAWPMLAHKNRVRCQEALIGYERSCGSVGTKR